MCCHPGKGSAMGPGTSILFLSQASWDIIDSDTTTDQPQTHRNERDCLWEDIVMQ